VFRLLLESVRHYRAGDIFGAYVQYQFALAFIELSLLSLGLFWTIAVKPRLILLFGVLAMIFYIGLHGIHHSGLSLTRLIYICIPGFLGLGRALGASPKAATGLVVVSFLLLLAQEIFTDINEIVI
jgi:hypothetical protein